MTKPKRSHGEGTYHRRPNGMTQYRVMVDGRRVTGTGRNRTEAKRMALERAGVVGQERTTETVEDLFADWCKVPVERTGIAPTTRDGYRYLIGKHVIPSLGEVQLERLTRRRVADAVDGFAGSQSTRRSTYAALVRLLDYAVETSRLRANVAREVPRPTQPRIPERSISQEQAHALIEAASGHRLGIVAFLVFGCGLRRGEALGLRWDDVDLEGRVIHVSGNVTRSSAGLVRGVPKTRRGLRQVPLPGVVADALKAHKKRQAADRLAAGAAWSDSGVIVANEIGGLVEPRAVSRAWRTWARKAKVQDTGMHLGRHYAATTLLASGNASVADVAAILGHDPAVLLNTYASAVAHGQRAASDVLGASLPPVSGANPAPMRGQTR